MLHFYPSREFERLDRLVVSWPVVIRSALHVFEEVLTVHVTPEIHFVIFHIEDVAEVWGLLFYSDEDEAIRLHAVRDSAVKIERGLDVVSVFEGRLGEPFVGSVFGGLEVHDEPRLLVEPVHA